MNPKISVIVPVYNGEKTIRSSIKTIQNQTFNDFEIIIVDDCSTDDTLKILQEIRLEDPRIRIICKEKNERSLLARLTAVEVAFGEWICFLDADDYLYPNALEKLYNQTDKNTNVILGAYCNTYDRFGLLKSKPKNLVFGNLIEGIYEVKDPQFKFDLAFWGRHSIFVSSCARLYKKSVFQHLKSYDLKSMYAFDDTLMNLIIFENIDKVVFIKDVIINYKYGGGTSKLNIRVLNDLNELFLIREKLIDLNYNIEKRKFSDIEYLNTIYHFFLNALIIEKWNYSKFEFEINRLKESEVYRYCLNISNNYNLPSALFFNENNTILYNNLMEEADRLRFKRLIKRKIGGFLANI